MESFRFKEFEVRQSRSAMKVNTDGVLLGAWLALPDGEGKIPGVFRVLDIGTGTGVISLIVAQRLSKLGKFVSSFSIEAIDIDKPSAEEARFNFAESPWAGRMAVGESSLQNLLDRFNGEKYSLILSNPPYFIDSLKARGKRRTAARHNDDLPFEVIIDAAVTMLDDEGILAVVLPREEGERFIGQTAGTSLQLARRCRVKTLAGKVEKRYLMEFVKTKTDILEEVLVMQETGGLEYTEQYKKLTGDFYLNF